ncbi:oncostatin-M [Phalacrocorax aristotelis]|uniref:oncostatin-M n=1 Tax=Phalacrocorax aristotelis TaxID=126867 RepID=UPI003F4BFA0B
MAEDAQELFAFYEKDQHLAINNLCRTNHLPEWLRGPVTGPGALRGTMTRMAQALQDIARHQRDLNPPGAEILRRLASTHLKVRGLLNNLEGLFPAPSLPPGRRPPPGPTAPTKVFQQKLEGCRILWSYARFMAKLSAQLEGRSRGGRREKRRSHRGSWLLARS